MRILYFHQHFTTPRGASGTRSYEFARALVACGHSVTIVCGSSDASALGLPPVADTYTRGTVDGVEVIALPVPYSNRHGLARRAWVFAKFALRSLVIALREPCDLVFATSTPLTVVLPGVLARIFRRKPFVFEVRDLWPALPRALGLRNPFLLATMSLLEWCGYRAADGLVGLSPGIVDGIRVRAPRKTPVVMIPNGCDLELFKPLEHQGGAPVGSPLPLAQIAGLMPGDFVAGFTGAHGIANGLEAVLAAASVLKRRGAAQIKFLFVGDGNCKEAMLAQARRDGLDNCIFMAPVPKTTLARLTASLDCGLMILRNIPAFYHGTSPNKFFDYIAAGIPVLNNYPGWLANLIDGAGCGVVVPPDSPEAFADALESLAATARMDNNVAMRRAARHLAETQFSREMLASAFCEFLAKTSGRASSL